jgi:hypothetical protein
MATAAKFEMRWIRWNIRPNAWLALIALAVQLAVSFGHMHSDDLGFAPLSANSVLASRMGSDLTHSPAVPADRDHKSTSDALCPICASISLAAALILPLPPQLDAPAQVSSVRLSDAQTSGLSKQFRLSFQARAPPVA